MPATARSLHEKGFIVLRNALTPEDVQYGMSCIHVVEQKVNYMNMQSFIENAMFRAVGQHLKIPKMTYVKYRVSDNNNSVDAAAFHRDIIPIVKTPIPCFTCLAYFDETGMEVIPASHTRTYSISELPSIYNTRVRIQMRPGDILLFCSTLLHRGIFDYQTPHRRLVQVFEVFLHASSFATFAPRIAHIPGDETFHDWMLRATKRNGLILAILNGVGFINAAMGYGSPMCARSACSPSLRMCWFFSSEGLCDRICIKPGTWQDINKYVIRHTVGVVIGAQCKKKVTYYLFNRQFIIYIICMLLLVVAVLAVAWMMYAMS